MEEPTTGPEVREVLKALEGLSDNGGADLERGLNAILLALGTWYWTYAKDQRARGELSAEQGRILMQTANYLRKLSDLKAPMLSL